jgi:sugar phosphate permease
MFDNPTLFFTALFVYGSGTATNLQAPLRRHRPRPPHSRGTAVSVAMVSTTFGAVARPNSVGVLGEVAETLGNPVLAGTFLLASVAHGIAGVIRFLFLRPDPLITARQIVHDRHEAATASAENAEVEALEPVAGSPRGVAVGATIMVLLQIAMVAIITMTPVHMRGHHHSVGEVGVVIGMHIGAKFLPSLITGRLVDRVGRVPMAVASAVTLLAAGLVAAFAPGDSMTLLTVALVLLGLGWNFGLISGTALIVDATALQTRAKTQGAVDVLTAIAGAAGGAISGVVVGASSYAPCPFLAGSSPCS